MTANQKFKSDAFEAIHSSARALYKVGAINKTTLRGFDDACLSTPPKLNPKEIKKFESIIMLANPSLPAI